MHVTLKSLKEIRLDWRPKTRLDEYNHDPTVTIRQEAAKLYWISCRSELVESIKVFSKLIQISSSVQSINIQTFFLQIITGDIIL